MIEGIEVIDCDEIVDSNHRGCLTDANLETCFGEDFNRKIEIERRLLNHNKRNHRKIFVETCEELLNLLPIDNELNCTEVHKDREKIEQVDKDTTFLLQKVRREVEEETKGMRGCKEKTKKRAAVQHWNMVVKNK